MTEQTSIPKKQNDSNEILSNREIEILKELARGISNKEISVSLGITINTVEKHLTSIYKKLGVTCRAEAILWCIEKGGVFRN
ncbi:MAG TPA: LuxR C-terminal-related transcriptional regulator [Candidatus Nitrosotenuis sp.]|nr:LuxR C-terminal-related transcriptional regulator [Candidatus Nitrosotenuis sp.]